MKDTYGPSSHDSCASSDRLGSSLRTCLASELQRRTKFSGTWREKTTPAGRSWWVLDMQGLRTAGIESGFWGTPTSRDWKGAGMKGQLPSQIRDFQLDETGSSKVGRPLERLNPDWVTQLMGFPDGWLG